MYYYSKSNPCFVGRRRAQLSQMVPIQTRTKLDFLLIPSPHEVVGPPTIWSSQLTPLR